MPSLERGQFRKDRGVRQEGSHLAPRESPETQKGLGADDHAPRLPWMRCGVFTMVRP